MFEIADTGGIRTITMNRRPVNAVSSDAYRELIEVVERTDRDDTIQVVLFASALPHVFCAGADVNEVASILGEPTGEADVRRQELARDVYERVRAIAQPSIAVIEGAALGAGAVLASVCDIRVGSTAARIGLPEITVGRCGGARHLSRYLPPGRLRRMYFTGMPMDGTEAKEYGLIDELTEPGGAYEAAMDIAERIASNSPLALRLAKRALNESEFEPLLEGYMIEQSYTVRLGRSADAREALAAFFEKRDPVWQGQ
ncbi:enoyl-CoA hydratase-related protein [Rhizomonospora bruguierae]|uniref:enoyl-CoA hydratase-related protein n=1 Tax=Rhizomonospora bruguierae TaxID=1581705 RepID=UPI001BCCB731|nr:enoyl-CoA hydratase-related protein [Micromonospora sp. NBRC 107566]